MKKDVEKFGGLNRRSRQKTPAHKYFAARLLSQKNNETILEKELILKNVMQQLPQIDGARTELQTMHGFNRIRKLAAIGVVMAVCALGLFSWLRFSDRTEKPEFTAKGDGTSSSFFEVHCLNSDNHSGCVPGSRLTISFVRLAADSFFSAFAIRESDGLTIWMFPAQKNESSTAVSRQVKTLPDAIVLDDLYPPGMYEIYGILSDHALTRLEIKSLVLTGANQETEKTTTGDNSTTSISRVKIHVEKP